MGTWAAGWAARSPRTSLHSPGSRGIINAAQMAQAASALQQSVQQSGLGPYFMQQAYAPQLAQAQLQQVCSRLILVLISTPAVLYDVSF